MTADLAVEGLSWRGGGKAHGMEENTRRIKGITTAPRGNQDVEKVDLERGLAKLERIVGN
jgi:hypothetical protein